MSKRSRSGNAALQQREDEAKRARGLEPASLTLLLASRDNG